jgi:hypothetical protein
MRWRFERADKGGGAVLISRQRWKREARKQVEGKEAYAKANEIEKEFREENLDPKGVRWLEGATGDNNSIRLWRSSLDFKPLKKDIGEERREGEWTSEEVVIRSTLTRLEYRMTHAEFGSSTQEERRRRECEMGSRENRHTEQIGNESHCPGGDSKATQDTSRTKARRKSFCEPDEAARDVRQQPAGRGDWRWRERKK